MCVELRCLRWAVMVCGTFASKRGGGLRKKTQDPDPTPRRSWAQPSRRTSRPTQIVIDKTASELSFGAEADVE